MANLPKEKTDAKKIIFPLNAKKVVVGLELDNSDQLLLQYFKFINQFLKAESITCVHVAPETSATFPFQALFLEQSAEVQETLHKELMQKMESELDRAFTGEIMRKLKYSIETGSPLETLTKVAEDAEADLVCIGKRAGADYHVIKAINVVRMVDANVLVAPDNSQRQLKTILVPVDFSRHSVRALQTALGFKHAALEPVRILGLHVYQRLSTYTRGLGMISAQQEEKIMEQQRQALNQFIVKNFPEFSEDIEPLFVEYEHPDVARKILEKAGETGADLIVMGAKGHSQLSLILVGSTTEQLLRENEKTPVLVVK